LPLASMFAPDVYQLLDFGAGRRLEQFGPWRIDRPCPAAEEMDQADAGVWQSADARFERTGATEGRWVCRNARDGAACQNEVPERWTIADGRIAFELKRTEFGHLGVFPEQAVNWEWIADCVRASAEPMRVLNLFAYTGGSTLAAAAAGAEVFHVDAAKNVVAWARRNAELSGLSAAPIHWIAEDAMKYVRRELNRGNRYDAVILDPPSYGHGPHGEVWQLSKHLPTLLEMCGELTAGRRRFMLLTCHTPEFDAARLERLVRESLGREKGTGPICAATNAARRCPPQGRSGKLDLSPFPEVVPRSVRPRTSAVPRSR
jgi:23S rRNA (cytosine1962-C5)-methyltransferase